MPSIGTHHELKSAWQQQFCYLCGEPFKEGEMKSKDHVPPRSLFDKEDRDRPLILPTHESCNSARSPEDEVLGQLVLFLRGKLPRPERSRLAVKFFEPQSPNPMAGPKAPTWARMIYRCIRGFHTALYGEYVRDKGGFIYAPRPDGQRVDPGRIELTRALKQHRKIDRVDRVQCCNGKCLFECVWPEFDDCRPFCLFGLKIYDWEKLGDPPQRGCVGWYFAGEPPRGAARHTKIEVPVSNSSPLDPFAD